MTPVRPIASSMTSPRPEISFFSTILTIIGVLGACIDRLYSSVKKELGMHSRVALVAVLVVLSATVWAQQRDRASVPDKYKWDLTQIYASELGLARREGAAREGHPVGARVQGHARHVAGGAGRRRSSA